MRTRVATFKPVFAADGDEKFEDVFVDDAEEDVSDTLEGVQDSLDDLQDQVDEFDDKPKDSVLDVTNNIEDHYIAECDNCHEVFISAVVESESPIESVEGECPCCHEHSKQYLKWIVRSASSEE